MTKLLLSLAGGAAAVCLAVGLAQAAPTSTLESVKALGAEQSAVEQVRRVCHTKCHRVHRKHRTYRRCYRVCHRT
jgi:hypothetical protein